MQQPRLFEFRMGERSPETLVVADANRDAAALLTGWRAWPAGALALVGPKGSGKTHLALAWALESGARALAATAPPEAAAALFDQAQGRVLIEDADRAKDDAGLWRVLDLARTRSGAVLLTAASEPALWPTAEPALRSRLNALAVARLGEPDQALLDVVLRRLCREQFIQLSEDAARYLVMRMPRSFAAAHALAAALDETIVRGARPVTVPAARKALELAQARWDATSGEGEIEDP